MRVVSMAEFDIATLQLGIDLAAVSVIILSSVCQKVRISSYFMKMLMLWIKKYPNKQEVP